MQQTLRRPIVLLSAPLLLLGSLWLATGWQVPGTWQPLTMQLQGLTTIFLGIFIEALPFLLAGVLASVVIQAFVSTRWLHTWLPQRGLGAALAGSMLGMAFPVCECGAIPAARRLLHKGAPPATGIAFAMAAPVVNPVVIISTMIAFDDWRWGIWRVGATIGIAIAIGLITGVGFERSALLADLPAADHEHHQHERSLAGLLQQASHELFEMGRYLIVGALLAALMQTFISQDQILSLIQAGGPLLAPLTATVALMLLAGVLSVCSTVDAFLALAFVGLFPPGAIMAFLVFGPMIDIKSTLMLMTTFRKPVIAAMIALAFGMALVVGLAANVVF